jgi:DNA-binding winged helix-turn-helix (wHTH) protein
MTGQVRGITVFIAYPDSDTTERAAATRSDYLRNSIERGLRGMPGIAVAFEEVRGPIRGRSTTDRMPSLKRATAVALLEQPRVMHAALELDTTLQILLVRGRRIRLSRISWALITELANADEEPVTLDHLATAVWPNTPGTPVSSVRHAARITRGQLGENADLIETTRNGYRLNAPIDYVRHLTVEPR